MKETVLCYLESNHHYLMIRQHKQNENDGYFMGVGGKIEKGETKEQALMREVKEETNLTLIKYQYRAVLYFKDNDLEEIIHLYTSSDFEGVLASSEEGELVWINLNELKDIHMWAGDYYFLDKLTHHEPFFELSLFYDHGQLLEVLEGIHIGK